ncbi:MAG: PLP-dependent aminotransferase family protein [Sphaerobacter sp.]|nr:PLP-dependent aminotransferase family protein [Sphaerobacter sp.]
MTDTWSQRWSRRGKLAAAAQAPSRVPAPGMISFVFGDPDVPSLPLEDMAEAAEYLAEHNRRDALAYQNAITDGELNAALAEKLARDQGIHVQPEQIFVSHGASAGLSLLCDMLIDPGDVVLADAPAWMGATNMFRLAGAEVRGVDVGEDGADPAQVEAILDDLAREGRTPKFFYTIPTFQNPEGVELSLERRHALAKLADERDLLIVEDDAYVDLRFSGAPKPTLFSLSQRGNVIFSGTLSKTIAAGLRLGYLVGPADVVATLARGAVDTLRNSYTAALADWYIRSGRLAEHIQHLRQIYREKCHRMLAALEREMPAGTSWTRPSGGFFIWLTLPEGVDAVDLLPAAREAGVDYIPGTAFYSDGRGRRNLRLSYSGVTVEQIDEGIARLAKVTRAALAQTAATAD